MDIRNTSFWQAKVISMSNGTTPAKLDRRTFIGASLAVSSIASFAPVLAQPVPGDALALHDATALGELVRKKSVSPLELVDAAIARIERLDTQLNTVSAEGFEQARKRAREMNTPTGAFAGVPYLIKDLMEYPSLPFESGSRMFKGNVSDWRSDYVAANDASGLVVLGKSATPEFGLLTTTESLKDGPTRNPWNPDYSPGGSSGGSCAAVAAGLVPFAHASDGGGSIRIPSALCGLFGFKPSRGRQRVSRRTQQPIDLSIDHCVSWSVRDSARLLSLTEIPAGDGRHTPLGFVSGPGSARLKIGCILTSPVGDPPSANTRNALRRIAATCESLGHEVDHAEWPYDGEEFETHFMTVWAAGAASIAQRYAETAGRAPDESVLEPWTLGLAAEFAHKGMPALEAALAYLNGLSQAADDWFSVYDVILAPVIHEEKLRLGALAPTRNFAELRADLIGFAPYTAAQNVIGAPAMSVPIGLSPDGFPIGGHFWSRAGNDAALLQLAYELEQAAPWAQRRPAIHA